MAPPRTPLIERLWQKIYVVDDHWLYDGYHDREGYARAASSPWEGRRWRGVHAWVWEHINGPLPARLEPDHLCGEKGCCNPDHLEIVTHQINAQRRSAKITECPQHHPYDEANTYVDPTGRRHCRECMREARRGYRARSRTANGR